MLSFPTKLSLLISCSPVLKSLVYFLVAAVTHVSISASEGPPRVR